MLRAEQDHEFIAGSTDVSGANGKNGVAGFGLLQEKFDGRLHRAQVVNILVPSFADGGGQRFAIDSVDGPLACGIDVCYDEKVRLIECEPEFVPKLLRAGVAVRLEENKARISVG